MIDARGRGRSRRARGPVDEHPQQPQLPLPDKEYFRIGEASKIGGVKPYVLRYWETEFKRDIRPDRTRSNQRMYRRRDVQTFLEIKRLRYEENLEVTGARRKLRTGTSTAKAARSVRSTAANPLEPGEIS